MTTRVASLVVASNKKARFLFKYGSRIGYVTKWRDAASIHLSMSVEAVSYQTSFTREAVHREQMRTLLYDEAPFQSEMLQSTTASDLPDARSTHENVPQTDDPLFLGPDLAEHADRIKNAEQQDELKGSAAHTTYAALSLCAWPAKTSWAIMVAHGL